MKKHLIGTLAVIALLASCKKDKTDNNTAGIEGTYKLKYISAKTNSTLTGSFGDKVVTLADYTTENNQGTVVFDGSTISATGLAYSVNSSSTYYLYDGPDLIDSASFPLILSLPATSSTAPYQLIGSDSIYFPQGSATSPATGGATTTVASGGRYSWNGNELTIKQNVSRDSTFQDSGETYLLKESAVTSFVLDKQ